MRDNHRIFAGFNNLRSVKFLLPWVTHIGNDWLRQCDALENPIFTGMSSLVKVGSNWMFFFCEKLKNPSFIGLSGLLEVGSHWMCRCRALGFRDYDGLSSLDTVGGDWMGYTALMAPNFTGLSSLEKVGSYWMSWCNALKNPSFTGLSSVTRVGPHGHITVQQYFNIYIDQF